MSTTLTTTSPARPLDRTEGGGANTAKLQRETFTTSRLLEYFSEKELTLQTGHDRDAWPDVLVKELVDNALDAAEGANVAPAIQVVWSPDCLTVTDTSICRRCISRSVATINTPPLCGRYFTVCGRWCWRN